MKTEAFIKISPIGGTKPKRYVVELVIDHQSFVMGGEFWQQTKGEAHWFQRQLLVALERMVKNVTGADIKKEYQARLDRLAEVGR